MTARPIEPAALSVPQAAQYLGISRSQMYRLSAECGAGSSGLPVVHIGGRRLFRRTDLDRYLSAHVVRPGRRTA